jgi:serine/threonine protein kinase
MARTYRIGDEPVPGYRLVKLLGRGGFGEVWKVAAPGGVEAALKIITLTHLDARKGLHALRLVRQIHHPNLVPIQACWPKDKDGQFLDDDSLGSSLNREHQELELLIAMGLGDKSLLDRLKECQKQGLAGIPRDELLDYMEQAARAVDFLNQPLAIQHCDIKPQNIILVGDTAQVCDLGLARMYGESRVTQAGISPAYAAPELITENKPSRWTDQYSLAVTYIQLRTGSLPFDDRGLHMIAAILQGNLDLSKLPEPEQEVLRRATAVTPDQRFPCCAEMVKALRRAEPGRQPVEAVSRPPIDSSRLVGRVGKTEHPEPTKPSSGETAYLRPSIDADNLPLPSEGDTLMTMTPGTPSSQQRPVRLSSPREESGLAPYRDENVQFTVFRPRTIEPLKWYPMLTFAHLDELPADAAPDEPDPIEEMKRQAEQILGKKLQSYRKTTHDSRAAIHREGEITFVPEVPGIEFNPPRRTFMWVESVHREEFRLRASPSLDGQTAKGSLSVFLGSILLADIALSIRVHGAAEAGHGAEPPQRSSARPYRKIFASYSHKDLPIVTEFERYARALGDTFLRDWTHLRAGEVWSERLERMIEEADVFQLFWSWNALNSAFVEQEWRYALRLNRPHFIRPTYWEDPLPVSEERGLPPADLRQLHFQRLTLSEGLQPMHKDRFLAPCEGFESRRCEVVPDRPASAPVVPPLPAAMASPGAAAAPRYKASRTAARDRTWEARPRSKAGLGMVAILLLILGVLATGFFVAKYFLNLF